MDTAGIQAIWAKMPLAQAVVKVFQFVGNEARLQAIFNEHRGRCYDKRIRFPCLVTLIGDALLEHGGSGNQSFSRAREAGELDASKVAAYGKLGRLPVAVSQAFLAELSQALRELFPAPAWRQPPASLRGLNTITLDGKAIKRVAKRLKPLRKMAGGMLGGRALVAMHYESGLVIGMHADEDGDANDVRFVPDLLPLVRAQIPGLLLFLADSAFCDLHRFEEFTEDGNHFLVRRHPKVGFHPDLDRPAQTGIDAQGRTFREECGWLGAVNHPKRRYVRQITLLRPGEADVAILTDLVAAELYPDPAEELLEHYLQRWGIEQVFQKVTEVFHLQGLIGSTPKATIFQFAFCLVLYNLIHNAIQATPKGSLVSVAFKGMENQFMCEVADQGSGFSEVQRGNLFKPCHSSKEGGSGLGLAISKQLANSIGAGLELEETGPTGSRFVLVFARSSEIQETGEQAACSCE